MNKNVFTLTAFLVCTSFMISCSSNAKQEEKAAKAPVQEAQLVGNDKDEHGCIASAGYQWSELLKDCIRPFEKGIRMKSTFGGENTSAVYLVFNADSSEVEVFLPKGEPRPILSREQADKNEETWTSKTGSPLSVKYEEGEWCIYHNCTRQYVSETKE